MSGGGELHPELLRSIAWNVKEKVGPAVVRGHAVQGARRLFSSSDGGSSSDSSTGIVEPVAVMTSAAALERIVVVVVIVALAVGPMAVMTSAAALDANRWTVLALVSLGNAKRALSAQSTGASPGIHSTW